MRAVLVDDFRVRDGVLVGLDWAGVIRLLVDEGRVVPPLQVLGGQVRG